MTGSSGGSRTSHASPRTPSGAAVRAEPSGSARSSGICLTDAAPTVASDLRYVHRRTPRLRNPNRLLADQGHRGQHVTAYSFRLSTRKPLAQSVTASRIAESGIVARFDRRRHRRSPATTAVLELPRSEVPRHPAAPGSVRLPRASVPVRDRLAAAGAVMKLPREIRSAACNRSAGRRSLVGAEVLRPCRCGGPQRCQRRGTETRSRATTGGPWVS